MSTRHKLAVVVLLVAYLIPIWLYPLFPSQDGPSHLYNTVIFSDLLWNPHSDWSKVYEIHWAPFPNWTFTLLASLLYPQLPIGLVEKIILSVYLVSFIAAVFYFVRSFDAEKTVLGFAGFLFPYNWFLWMGFYNFCLSIPLALVVTGFALRHRGRICGPRLVLLLLLFLLLYLSHLVSFVLAVGAIAALFGGFGRKRWRALAQLILSSAPALALFIGYFLTQPPAKEQIFWAPAAYLAANFFSFKIGPWFHPWETAWFVLLWIVLGVWLFLTAQKFREWGVEERIGWLIVAAVGILSVAVPYNLLGGTSLNERLSIFVGLFLLAALSPRRWTLPAAWLAAVFAVLVAAQLLYIHLIMRDWNRRLEPFQQLAHRIASHSKVLPLIYAENVVGIYPNPLLHAESYALADSRSVSPNNYEGFTRHFPVRYKSKTIIPVPMDWYRPDSFLEGDLAKHYDYVIEWNASRPAPPSTALRGFVPVFAQGDLVLLKRR